MKTIKKVISINPEILHETEVLKIIQMRLMDVSSSTRESSLDLLWSSLTQISESSSQKMKIFQREFMKKYLPIIVERADDTSLGVRKRVVQILSYIL